MTPRRPPEARWAAPPAREGGRGRRRGRRRRRRRRRPGRRGARAAGSRRCRVQRGGRRGRARQRVAAVLGYFRRRARNASYRQVDDRPGQREEDDQYHPEPLAVAEHGRPPMRSMMQKAASATSTTARMMTGMSAPEGACISAADSGSLVPSLVAGRQNPSAAGAGVERRRRGLSCYPPGRWPTPHRSCPRTLSSAPTAPRSGAPWRACASGWSTRPAATSTWYLRGRARRQGARKLMDAAASPGTHLRHPPAAGAQRPQVEREGAAADRRLPQGPHAGHVRRRGGRDDRRPDALLQGGREARRRPRSGTSPRSTRCRGGCASRPRAATWR